MTKLKIQSTRKNEKGIALVFTLVMLSLLMILAMSFALDSMFSQKAAYNSASSSSSGFMGQAQLEQVLLLMKNDQANFDANRLYSKDISYDPASPSTSVEDTDMLVDRLPVDGVLASDDGVLDPTVKVNWNYVKNSDGKIIGRTAFVVIPKEKIPLNSLISKTVDESGGGATAPEVYDEKRIGKNVSEINIRKVMYEMNTGDSAATYTITPAMANKFNWDTFSGGLFTGTWDSYSKIFGSSVLNLGDSDDEEKFKQNFINSFELDSTNDKEAFWADLNNDTTADDNELYKRFDLTRIDWDCADNATDFLFTQIILLLTYSGTTFDMEVWKDEDSIGDPAHPDYNTKASRGLPWLAAFGYKDDGTGTGTGTSDESLKGTFATVKDRRFQIAANLKDYCDNDGGAIRPTSDVDPAKWVSGVDGVPTFTGNEKTPYINKIGVRVEHSLEHKTIMFVGDITKIETRVQPVIGLVNIYKDTPTDLQVTISGSVTTEIAVGSTDIANGTYGDPKTTPFSRVVSIAAGDWSSTSPAYTGHSTLNFGLNTDGSDRTQATHTVAVALRVTDVTINKVILHANGDDTVAYDYVKTLNQTPNALSFEESSTDGTVQSSWFGFAVNDPRQNLNAGDWVTLTSSVAPTPANTSTTDDNPSKTFSVVVGNPPYYCAPNCQNSLEISSVLVNGGGTDTESPTIGPDPETTNNPANGNLSTAYIRNAPMESPWELGFIHRGAKWQTLNLKKYYNNSSDTSDKRAFQTLTIGGKKFILGGGAYANGDANILDQIKMTKSAESPEKINVAAQKKEIHKALFANIMKGSTIDGTMTVASMADTGTALTLTDANITTIMSLFTTVSDSNRTRSCVADTLAGFTGGTKDAEQEELIGKMINLTKISGQKGSGSYTVIVLAQAINDIGGPGTTEIKVYRVPADGGTAIEVRCKTGTFDTEGGDADWKKNAYGDEVTGEQKIIAEINCSPGETVIKSIKYID